MIFENRRDLREIMRRWVSGVAVVTAMQDQKSHGMTVNSFTSISLKPAFICVTLAHPTRTHQLVMDSGLLGLTILSASQKEIADRFAGHGKLSADRFAGLDLITFTTGIPLLADGLAWLECRVKQQFDMPESTMFVGEVLFAARREEHEPLVYFNREYRRLA
jgi:flavin reductase (DIM6/NTAB) family NADH-FMN oxidoreductase RutF